MQIANTIDASQPKKKRLMMSFALLRDGVRTKPCETHGTLVVYQIIEDSVKIISSKAKKTVAILRHRPEVKIYTRNYPSPITFGPV